MAEPFKCPSLVCGEEFSMGKLEAVLPQFTSETRLADIACSPLEKFRSNSPSLSMTRPAPVLLNAAKDADCKTADGRSLELNGEDEPFTSPISWSPPYAPSSRACRPDRGASACGRRQVPDH